MKDLRETHKEETHRSFISASQNSRQLRESELRQREQIDDGDDSGVWKRIYGPGRLPLTQLK